MLATLAVSLFTFVIYVYFTEVLVVISMDYGTLVAEILTLIGLWIVFNLFFNYLRAMIIGPGYSPTEVSLETKALLADDPQLEPGHSHRFCAKCNRIKPMRSHHCSICRKCVLKMDHHCPWVNNCIGWRNMRHFLLFLVYLWAGSGFFLFVSVKETWKALTVILSMFLRAFSASSSLTSYLPAPSASSSSASPSDLSSLSLMRNLPLAHPALNPYSSRFGNTASANGDMLQGEPNSASFLIAMVMSFSAFLATTAFISWNGYLLFTNQSTIECSGGVFKGTSNGSKKEFGGYRTTTPFHMGWRRNICAVFGEQVNFWNWLMPTLKPPPGDGLVFPVVASWRMHNGNAV
jgi:hypothetical protein